MNRRKWILRNELTGREHARGTQLTCRRQKDVWRAFFEAYRIPCDLKVALDVRVDERARSSGAI